MTKVAVIGLGMIGGSIAAGLKRSNPGLSVMAWDKNPDSLDKGIAAGLIDLRLESLEDIDADLAVIALPLRALEDLLPRLDFSEITFTDVCSVKGYVLDTFKRVMGAIPQKFVPGHPIAGSEQQGVAAADPDLFAGRRVILTPVSDTDNVAIDNVVRMWRDLGATTSIMTPEHHDHVLAQTSHLPHLLAYALVDSLSFGGNSLEVFKYAAGGFRDFSRIAASDPVIWRDIFLTNQKQLLEILDRYVEEISVLRRLISEDDGDQLETILARAKLARDHFSEITQSDA